MTVANWRSLIPAKDLEHYERVWAREQETARKAEREGVTYHYVPWHEARGNRSLIGKRATRAYWISGFGRLPWGHQHAHAYTSAFQEIVNIGADFVAFETDGSQSMISYDTLCVQERTRD
jgi:hypothetical protein